MSNHIMLQCKSLILFSFWGPRFLRYNSRGYLKAQDRAFLNLTPRIGLDGYQTKRGVVLRDLFTSTSGIHARGSNTFRQRGCAGGGDNVGVNGVGHDLLSSVAPIISELVGLSSHIMLQCKSLILLGNLRGPQKSSDFKGLSASYCSICRRSHRRNNLPYSHPQTGG